LKLPPKQFTAKSTVLKTSRNPKVSRKKEHKPEGFLSFSHTAKYVFVLFKRFSEIRLLQMAISCGGKTT
jgi:hypothetical protein